MSITLESLDARLRSLEQKAGPPVITGGGGTKPTATGVTVSPYVSFILGIILIVVTFSIPELRQYATSSPWVGIVLSALVIMAGAIPAILTFIASQATAGREHEARMATLRSNLAAQERAAAAWSFRPGVQNVGDSGHTP